MLQAIRLLGAMVTPSSLLAEGYIGITRINLGHTVTRSESVGSDHTTPSTLEIQQQIARIRLRACNGIRPLLQLLNYRRSVAHVEFIRLATMKVLCTQITIQDNHYHYSSNYLICILICIL